MKSNQYFLGSISLIFALINFLYPISLAKNYRIKEAFPQNSAKLPPPPQTSPPRNKTKPGGGLDPELTACDSKNGTLTALIPEENAVFTTSEKPVVLIYLPDDNTSISKGEFWVNTSQGKNISNVTIPVKSGIIQVKTPITLELNEYTPWYFKITCKNNRSMIIYGWFYRVTLIPEAEKPESSYDVWANTAQNLQNNPNNEMLKNRWFQLLKTIKAEDLVNQPIY
ncbi:DUF928 domain-containing protein [Aphanothece sacrum]|uniref:DUF928 domain-containing protein n=1 Tax=Aphanothece sacrum FPU1 TaxID=1920663 RepID=A0A401ILA0_APHSA|nr:DUF928 domain-containing protein [Aphanothece sacrum]GBF82016.1 hypothetical protein AsFPU1_3439 [Aphanothece sacrum FPU1]GBF85834.1 hypothetical protein AsFPU3_2901 [Aphanothece sacrum FPU3]